MTRRLAPHPDDQNGGGINWLRPVLWLVVLALVLIAIWTAVWFYMADQLQSQTRSVLSQMRSNGATAECADDRVAGYPFRLGMICEEIAYGDDGRTVRAGQLRITAKITDLSDMAGELQGPLDLELPGLDPAVMNWDTLQFSTRYAEPVPEAAAIDIRNGAIRLGDNSGPLLNVGHMQMQGQLNGTDLALAARLQEVLFGDVEGLPALRVEYDGIVANAPSFAMATGLRSFRGLSGRLHGLRLATEDGDAALEVSGDYAVDREGLLSGDVEIRVESPERMGDLLATLVPGEADALRTAFDALESFTINGDKTPPIPIRIKNGEPSLLFLKLPRIPPLP